MYMKKQLCKKKKNINPPPPQKKKAKTVETVKQILINDTTPSLMKSPIYTTLFVRALAIQENIYRSEGK